MNAEEKRVKRSKDSDERYRLDDRNDRNIERHAEGEKRERV